MIRIPVSELNFYRVGADVPLKLINQTKGPIPGAYLDDGDGAFTIEVQYLEVELPEVHVPQVNASDETDDLRAELEQWKIMYESLIQLQSDTYDLATLK